MWLSFEKHYLPSISGSDSPLLKGSGGLCSFGSGLGS